MIVKIKLFVGTRYLGSDVTEEIEVEYPDNATEKEIEEIKEKEFQDWLWDNINCGWEDIK